MAIIKRIQSNYNSILRAKLYFFFKKSVWMYLFGMLILGYVFPLASFGTIISALIYLLIFIIIVLIPVYHFSTKALEKNKLDADIEFDEQNIVIRHRNKDLIEVKEWTWVKQIDITKSAVLLIADQPHRFLISFDRAGLPEHELQFFIKKKSERKPL